MPPWPLVARTAVLDSLLGGLTGSPARAQLLRGASGVGKTTLAASVASALAARGRSVVPVVALDELRGVPLGALAPLLATAPGDVTGDVGARLNELMTVVGRHAGEYLLVVDDAPLLDEASAAALYQLVRVFGVPTLLTARDEHTMTGAIARLLHEDLVTVTELAELTLDETRTLLSRRFAVEPRPETLQHLYERTRGNPLFLRELVLDAERSGRVYVDENGATVETANVPTHVLESVSGRLRALTEEQRSIIELVAVAQPWPRAAVLASEANAVIDLLDNGVLVPAEPSEAGYLHLAHSLYAEAILARLSAAERAERRRTAAERLLRIDEETVRFTALCLLYDAQGEIATNDLVWAAERAHRVGDHARAVQLADRALGDARDQLGPATGRAALARAVALSAIQGGGVEVDDAFALAAELASDDDARARVELRWGQHTALRAHDPAAAVARASQLVAQLDEVAADLLAPDLAKWKLMAGDASAVDQALDQAAVDDTAAALGSALSQAMMGTMLGRVDDARAAVDAGRPLADRFADVQPYASDLLDLSTFLVHVAEGRIADARSFAEERRLKPFADSAGIWSYALALIALHAGRLSEAASLAALAVQQLRWRDFTGLVGPALALSATVHAQRGELDRARDLLAQLADAHRDDVKVVLQAAEAEAWIAVHEAEPERAVTVIATAVGRGLELGHLLLASLTASVAVRIGGASVIKPLTAAAAQASSSVLTATIFELANAVAGRDAAAVIALAPTLDRAGLAAAGHDAVAQAIEWSADDRMLQRRARVIVADLARLVEPVRMASSARVDFGLTEREWLIAQAAARRERSREIAERLGVSVRTVDNHLASVYRKLGINGRGELEEELRGQL